MANEKVVYVFEAITEKALKGFNDIDKAFKSMTDGFKRVSNVSKSFSKSIDDSSKSLFSFKKALSAISGVAIGKALAQGTKSAIDFYETLNLFNVAMKDSIDTGKKFIANAAEWYGLDPKNLMQYVGTFYEMAYAVGAPDQAARTLSTSLTALSVDLASLFNVDVSKVTDNLTSGLRGMSRAVVRYGLDLRASTVEAYAHSKGLDVQFESLNEASREILRYLTAINQAKDVTQEVKTTTDKTTKSIDNFGNGIAQSTKKVGDFARTIEQPANQLRVFQEQIAQLGRAIGTFLVKPLQAVLPVINGFVMALRIMLETFAALLGFKKVGDSVESFGSSADKAAGSVGGIGSAADKAKKKVQSLLAPFDELNILQEDTASPSGGAGAGGGLDFGAVDPKLLELLEQSKYELSEVRMKALDTRDAILDFFGFVPKGDSWIYYPEIFERNLLNKFPQWKKTISTLFDFDYSVFLSNVKQLFSTITSIAKNAISMVISDFARLLGLDLSDATIAAWIETLNDKLRNLNQFLLDNFDTIVKVTTRILEAIVVFKLLAGLFSIIQKPVSVILSLVSGLGVVFAHLGQVIGWIVSAIGAKWVAAIALLVGGFISGFKQMWEHSKQFRENMGTLFENIGNMLKSLVKLIGSVVKTVIGLIKPIVTVIGNILQPIYPLIVGIINSVVGAITGVIEIIDGLLNMDLKQVFKGFMKVLMSLVEGVMNIGAGIVNAIISVIVGALNALGNIVYGFVSMVIKSVNSVAELIGLNGFNLPDKSLFIIDHVPQIVPPALDYAFATGGVVTGPTRALIGEAGRSEAVIPLDNSPQMIDLIDKIADKVSNTGETIVKVIIGEREWDTFTYESAQRGRNLVGSQPIREGRA